MKHLTYIQSILAFLHFFRNNFDFPSLSIYIFGMEIALTFPELSLGQMKPEHRDNLLREQFFSPLQTSKNLSYTQLCQVTWNNSFSFSKGNKSKESLYHFSPSIAQTWVVEEKGYSFTNSPPPWVASGFLFRFQTSYFVSLNPNSSLFVPD